MKENEIKQKVYVNEDLEVEISSNAPHVIGKEEVYNGDFIIDAESLARILPVIDKNLITYISQEYTGNVYIANKELGLDWLKENKKRSQKKFDRLIRDYDEVKNQRDMWLNRYILRMDILEKIPSWIIFLFCGSKGRKYIADRRK